MTQPCLLCYRLNWNVNLDEEIIWAYVQRSGGHINIRQDIIDFWVPPWAELFLVCAWPELERRPDLDYI